MRRWLLALSMVALPLLWSFLLWAAWHCMLVKVLFPLSLALIAVPACLGYAAVLVFEWPSPQPVRSSTRSIAGAASATLAVAYACALYAWGEVLAILPEYYKFNAHTVPISKSAVELWASLSLLAFLFGLVLRRVAYPGTLSRKLGASVIGITLPTAVLFATFLATGLVSFRP